MSRRNREYMHAQDHQGFCRRNVVRDLDAMNAGFLVWDIDHRPTSGENIVWNAQQQITAVVFAAGQRLIEGVMRGVR